MRTRPRPNGTTIEALRVAHHLSNSELARQVGVSRQYMGRIQEGERGASIKVLKKIADVFEVEVAYIVLPQDIS
jgi:transcriptional regulator with XRE-family HTH domain